VAVEVVVVFGAEQDEGVDVGEAAVFVFLVAGSSERSHDSSVEPTELG
jgi:hypothetical protein